MKNHPKKRTACLVPRPSQLVLRAHNGLSCEVYFAVGTWLDAAAVRTVKTKGVSGKNDDFAHAFYILLHFSICSAVTKRKMGRPIKEQLTNQTINWGELKE